MNNPIEMKEKLISILKGHCPPLIINMETEDNFEVKGNTPTMQGRKKVDGIYFASVLAKPKDARLYFFPIYTNKEAFEGLPENLRKCLKGKSCFHFKKINSELEVSLKDMIQQGIKIYKENKLIL
jgi:hypothetical protein